MRALSSLAICLAAASAAVCLPISIARAQLPGSVDLAFDPATVLVNADRTFPRVTALAVQPDGKVLVATIPNQQVGRAPVTSRHTGGERVTAGQSANVNIVRLNANGTLDPSFNATINAGFEINAIALQSNGKIVIAGAFTQVDGVTENNIASLNPDGTLDPNFNSGTGADSTLRALVVQPDGKIVIGGYLAHYNGTAVVLIARINANGSLDAAFNAGGAGFSSSATIQTLAIQRDRKILAGGYNLTTYNGTAVNALARLNPNGTLDAGFVTDADVYEVDRVAQQPTGGVIVSGYSFTLSNALIRLSSTGAEDPAFKFSLSNQAIALQPDGKVLVGGFFYYVGGVPRAHIARLNADGTLDTTFDPGAGANGAVEAIGVRADGEIFIAGQFNGVANVTRNVIALLYGVDLPGKVQLSASSYNVNENGGSLLVVATRTGGNAGAVSVNYATADGTAVAGTDYTATSGTLTWADGDLADKTFTVPITNPQVYTGSKSFTIDLGSPSPGLLLGIAQASVLILENDAAPQPVATLTSPPTDITVISGSLVPLSADVVDPGSILSNVQFTVNGAQVAQLTGAGPYVANITAGAPGAYTLSAIATDTQGRTSTSSHTLTVLASDPANPAPTVVLLTDINNRQFQQGAVITLSVDGSNGDGTPPQSVTFYADGVAFATVTLPNTSAHPASGVVMKDASASPTSNVFTANFTMPNTDKVVNLLAIALSKLGLSQSTPVASVQGVSQTINSAPVVSLTGITNGTTVKINNSLAIPAVVSDPNSTTAAALRRPRPRDIQPNSSTIARMEYYVNSLKVKDSAQQPYGFAFTPPAAGQYIVEAIATDGSGLSTVSTPISINAISLPVVTLSAVGDSTIVEGGKKGKVLFTRTNDDLSADLTVSYKVGGTAVNGVDFEPLSGSLVIPAGQASVKLKIRATDDPATHDPLKVNIKLLPPAPGSYDLGDTIKIKLLLYDSE